LKMQDGGSRHLGFSKMSITCRPIGPFTWNFNNIYSEEAIIEIIRQTCDFFENLRWRRPPSWIFKNVNNLQTDWTIWLKFYQNILKRGHNWNIRSDMRLFLNPRWRRPPYWICRHGKTSRFRRIHKCVPRRLNRCLWWSCCWITLLSMKKSNAQVLNPIGAVNTKYNPVYTNIG
jgi:hypothetical protein